MPKNNGRINFYECCDLTKKVYLLLCAINLAEKSQNGMLVGIFLLNLHIFIACKYIYMRNFLKRHTYNHMKLHIVAHLKYKDIWRQAGKKHSWILSGIFQIKLWRTNLQNCTKQLTQVSFHYASTIWLPLHTTISRENKIMCKYQWQNSKRLICSF